MSDFAIPEEAVKDLAEAARKDAAAARREDPPAETPPPSQQGAETATSEAEEAPQDDLGPAPSLDDVLADIPPEHHDAIREAYEARVAEFQGTFSRKTQELAEQRKQVEALGSLDDLAEAKEFYESIRYDQDFATDIWQQLGDALGLTPGEAQAVAEAAVEDPFPADEYSGGVDPQMEALRKEMQAMRDELAREREQVAYEEQRAALAARLAHEEAQVRQAHPDWDEDMIETVYTLASVDGVNMNLNHAAERIAALEQAGISRYLESKTSSSKTPSVRGGAGEGHVPYEPPESLDAGHAKARELWDALRASEG